jgi:type I restriction enzyme S subunit
MVCVFKDGSQISGRNFKLNFGTDMKQGWEIEEFEKCLEKVTYTNKIQRKDFKEEGIYPVVSQEKEFINGYWDNEDDLFRVDKPVVIFGDHTQVLKFVDFDFVLGADGVKILKPKEKIDPKYFYYFLQNIDLGRLGYARHYRLLKEINFAYPKSLPEQQRIVSILDETFAAIAKAKANAERCLRLSKALFESYLQGVFGGSTGSPTKRDGWEEKKLGEILVKTETVDPTKNPDTEFTYLDVSSVNKETKEIETPTVLLGKDAPSRAKKMIKTGDVIFATVRPTHSRVALIPEEFDEQVCSTGYFVLRSKDTVNNKLIFYYLLTKGFNEQMEKLQKGASYPAVTDNDIKGILFSFPKSKKEQQTIVQKLDALRAETQKMEEIYQKKLLNLEELKKSLLQEAFRGEL